MDVKIKKTSDGCLLSWNDNKKNYKILITDFNDIQIECFENNNILLEKLITREEIKENLNSLD